MTREKKEKLYKNVKTGICFWILKKGWFWYFECIDFMCDDISRMYQCSPHLVKRIFWELKKNNETFKEWLSDFEA